MTRLLLNHVEQSQRQSAGEAGRVRRLRGRRGGWGGGGGVVVAGTSLETTHTSAAQSLHGKEKIKTTDTETQVETG